MRLTRAQNVLRLAGNVQNRVDLWGSAPGPAEGAYDAPSDSLVVRGFLPSAIAASRLRRLQFPVFRGGIASITQRGIDATGVGDPRQNPEVGHMGREPMGTWLTHVPHRRSAPQGMILTSKEMHLSHQKKSAIAPVISHGLQCRNIIVINAIVMNAIIKLLANLPNEQTEC